MAEIWVVDDDATFLKVTRLLLEHSGFETREFGKGRDLLAAIRGGEPDLLLVDLGLPDVGGVDLVKSLRASGATGELPIIAMTGSQDQADRYVSLDSGCDDFVVKPFDPIELVLRIKARLRGRARGRSAPEPRRLEAGDLRLDPVLQQAEVAGRPVALTPSEFRILQFLMEHASRPVKTDDLLSAALGYPHGIGSPDTVRNHVRQLRCKIETTPSAPERLVSVPHLGYMFRPREAGSG